MLHSHFQLVTIKMFAVTEQWIASHIFLSYTVTEQWIASHIFLSYTVTEQWIASHIFLEVTSLINTQFSQFSTSVCPMQTVIVSPTGF